MDTPAKTRMMSYLSMEWPATLGIVRVVWLNLKERRCWVVIWLVFSHVCKVPSKLISLRINLMPWYHLHTMWDAMDSRHRRFCLSLMLAPLLTRKHSISSHVGILVALEVWNVVDLLNLSYSVHVTLNSHATTKVVIFPTTTPSAHRIVSIAAHVEGAVEILTRCLSVPVVDRWHSGNGSPYLLIIADFGSISLSVRHCYAILNTICCMFVKCHVTWQIKCKSLIFLKNCIFYCSYYIKLATYV